MTPMTRHMLIAALLGVLTAVVVGGGIVWSAWGRMSAVVEPWQRGWAGSSSAANGDKVQDLLVRLNAENVILRTRLEEYAEIIGEGRLATQQIVARSRILSRSLRAGRRYCDLDKGAVDGVRPGMAAMLGWSMVGIVVGVQDSRCLMQQLSDEQSRIPAALYNGESMLAEGVLAGLGKRAELRLDYVEDRPGLDVTAGMRVVTAGLDGGIPPGIGLGLVRTATHSPSSDHWTISVSPLQIADAADSVLIVRFVAGSDVPKSADESAANSTAHH
jgi:cell shape-determining protein MreC